MTAIDRISIVLGGSGGGSGGRGGGGGRSFFDSVNAKCRRERHLHDFQSFVVVVMVVVVVVVTHSRPCEC